MPKQDINYDITYFYKIVCRDLTIQDCYVGHTTNFRIRKNGHKTTCNNPNARNHNTYVYSFIRDNGGWDNFDMILIETMKCESKLDAERKERDYIENLNSTLNQFIPSRTKKEWTEDNKDHVKQYKHDYHINNIDTIHEQKKDYYQENKEHTLNRVKEHYKQNTEKCKEWKNKCFACACGGAHTNSTKARHEQTKKHKDYLNSLDA